MDYAYNEHTERLRQAIFVEDSPGDLILTKSTAKSKSDILITEKHVILLYVKQ